MIIGIGIDLVEVGRVKKLLARHPRRAVQRLFTEREAQHCAGTRRPDESFAARFAAKEALLKALGTGLADGATWCDVEVITLPGGAPRLHLRGATRQLADARGVVRAHVTLTHTREIAGAYVVLEGEHDFAT